MCGIMPLSSKNQNLLHPETRNTHHAIPNSFGGTPRQQRPQPQNLHHQPTHRTSPPENYEYKCKLLGGLYLALKRQIRECIHHSAISTSQCDDKNQFLLKTDVCVCVCSCAACLRSSRHCTSPCTVSRRSTSSESRRDTK